MLEGLTQPRWAALMLTGTVCQGLDHSGTSLAAAVAGYCGPGCAPPDWYRLGRADLAPRSLVPAEGWHCYPAPAVWLAHGRAR